MKFASRRDAGERLLPLVLAAAEWPDVLVLAIGERGRQVAEPLAASLDTPIHVLAVTQAGDGVEVSELPEVRDRTVLVVGDGVETGTAAHAIAATLDAHGAGSKVLAVGVCPRDALATLQFAYDEVIAVHKPLGRRSLTWHYGADADS